MWTVGRVLACRFTEENRSPRVGSGDIPRSRSGGTESGHLAKVDVTCVKSLRLSICEVLSPDTPSRAVLGEWIILETPDTPSRAELGEWIILETPE